jgi:transcriptional regulator with XRE-family HTH domain
MTTTKLPLWCVLGGARGKAGRANRAWLAELGGVDLDAVARWEKGSEPIPDAVLESLYDKYGFFLAYLMEWHDASRSAIPESLRDVILEEIVARAEVQVASDVRSLLQTIERRLHDEPHLLEASPELIARLQRLRSAVLEFVSESLELEAC